MEEKEYAGDYRIEQSFTFGRHHFVIGIDENAAEKYLLAERQATAFGYEYTEAVVSNDYLEIVNEFALRIQDEVEVLCDIHSERGSDGIPFGPEACREDSSKQNYENQILILNPAYLSPEYRTKEDQLVLAISGFGCAPGRRAQRILCQSLSDGEKFYIRGYDVLGIISQQCVPHWAEVSANLIRDVVQKERQEHKAPNCER